MTVKFDFEGRLSPGSRVFAVALLSVFFLSAVLICGGGAAADDQVERYTVSTSVGTG